MKYTPDELYNYVIKNDLKFDFINATMNNNKDFAMLLIETEFIKNDSKIFLKYGEMELIEITDKNLLKSIENKDNISIFISKLKDEYTVHYLVLDTFNQDEIDINITEFIIKTTLEILEINTKGKLKVFLEKGRELQEEFFEKMDYLESLGINTIDF